MENDFLLKLKEVILQYISDERFGVSELANEVSMSRSNLLRKIKRETGISASQFIREIRLQQGMELLKESSHTVSEVSYQVGFGSPSYFIKCFREYYGYPPGEAGKYKKIEDSGIQEEGNTLQHQLAAIMFTDIQGYTALMQQNEEKAIALRTRHRRVFEDCMKKFNGRILQYYGDGTLSTFTSAIDAVKCGISLQLAYREEPRIPVRIGIHSGDIIFSEDGIIGDGVNVASRIESLAVPQSVLISGKVYDEVKNQTDIQCKLVGTFELKNVGKATEIYAIANTGLIVPEQDQITGKLKTATANKTIQTKTVRKRMIGAVIVAVSLFAIIAAYGIFKSTADNGFKFFSSSSKQEDYRKSIVVLPFRNDSNDSSNVYIVNGLMEAILNNLQKIEDLQVISRTSAEKFRNIPKTIPEIARELNVSYIVEGSGQKIGNQILLNIQLIEARSDKHLMAEQYNRQVEDIFQLQGEVAKNIADKIQVIITPEVAERIDKPPTDNLVAYDYFLKGLEYLKNDQKFEAIPFFEKAIEEDPEFARAYAATTMAYYFLDEGQSVKQYTHEIEYYSDKALLLDAQLPQSLIARALNYMHNDEHTLAIPYLEKALKFNPNSDIVLMFLVDMYVHHLPDTEKYLEYALKGLQVDISAYDSSASSINFLHISNAFIQAGFFEEAEKYINMSLNYQPENLYSQYVKAYILYAKDRDLDQTKDMLLATWKKDTTRLDIIQEIGKINYFIRDYPNAYTFYNRYIEITKKYHLDIYQSENIKIAWVLNKVNLKDLADEYLSKFKEFADQDKSIYRNMNLALYYSCLGKTEKALEHMELFSAEDHYFYWVILFMDVDPLLDDLRNLARYKKIKKRIDSRFWEWHNGIRKSLERKNLIEA